MSTPTKYRKKPVVIEAMQWTSPEQADGIIEWAESEDALGVVDWSPDVGGPSDPETGEDWGLLEIYTLEGTMCATPRDYIIRGVQGEFYPCKPDIFTATYEEVAP